MLNDEFARSMNDQIQRCSDVLQVKGSEYADDSDRLSNFKKAAALQNSTPQRALYGMLAKHLVSVADLCQMEGIDIPEGVWTEKITDSLNYLFLLRAIIDEVVYGMEIIDNFDPVAAAKSNADDNFEKTYYGIPPLSKE